MYVKRDDNGKIVALSVSQSEDISEPVATDSAELALFLEEQGTSLQQSLAESDLQMARVLEDTINLLIDKGIIRFTDLPEAAQHKLMLRREIRDRVQAVDLLDDEGNIGL